MAGRFKVVITFDDGSRSRVMVWAEEPDAAIASVQDFFEFALRTASIDDVPIEATRVGDIPDQHDLNVTTDPKGVNHIAKNAKGEAVSTPSRPSADAIVRATKELRESSSAEWEVLRNALRRAGIAFDSVAVIASVTSGDPTPPPFGTLISKERQKFGFRRLMPDEPHPEGEPYKVFASTLGLDAADELGNALLNDGEI